MKRALTPLLATAILGLFASGLPLAAQAPEIPEDVRATIQALVDEGYITGIVVGVINPHGTAYFSYGEPRPPQTGTLDENSLLPAVTCRFRRRCLLSSEEANLRIVREGAIAWRRSGS